MKNIKKDIPKLSSELYELIEQIAGNADKLSTHYVQFLTEYYFLRELLKTDYPEIKKIVIEQLEQIIESWKKNI